MYVAHGHRLRVLLRLSINAYNATTAPESRRASHPNSPCANSATSCCRDSTATSCIPPPGLPRTLSTVPAGPDCMQHAAEHGRRKCKCKCSQQLGSSTGISTDRAGRRGRLVPSRASTSDPQRGAVEMRLLHFCTMTAGFIMLMEDSLGRERRRHATCCCHRARAGGAKPRVRVVRVVPLAGASLAGTPRHQ